MKKNYTKIVVILDRSGSMDKVKNATIEGFNSFIKDQSLIPGECDISLYQFDDQYEIVYENRNIKDAPYLDNKTFVPRGWTALLDAIGRTINSLGNQLSRIKESNRPSKVIVVIQTDGEENRSKEFKLNDIFEMISHQKNKYNWEFVFLGANQDAIKNAARMGIDSSSSITYANNIIGTSSLYKSLNDNIADMRLGRKATFEFTSDQRAEQEKELKKD